MSSVYEIITNKIIENLENGNIPWQKSWKVPTKKNFITKKAYQGINRLLLMNDYECPYYASFKQIQSKGWSVKKGEKSHMVVFWKVSEKEETILDDETGEELVDFKPSFILRYYRVFNLEQTDCPREVWESELKFENNYNPIEKAESIINNFINKPTIKKVNNDRCCYKPNTDVVEMPEKNFFNKIDNFYGVMFHELTHSTGHEKRLNRNETNYAKEELVAEIGCCFLSNEAGIKPDFDNSIAYIRSWLERLRNDSKLIIFAASQAEKSTEYILNQNKFIKEQAA